MDRFELGSGVLTIILMGVGVMKKYPTLEELKIRSPLEIARYSVQTVDDTDFLRIVYKRKKGVFLPDSKRYRFPRIKKTSVADSGTRKMSIRWEVSPVLRKATTELDSLLSEKVTKEEKRAVILDELKRLEQDSHMRILYIRDLIEEL